MIYQLPSGKIIYLSLEQYLELTDEDEQFLRATNEGEYPSSIWQDSALNRKTRIKKTIIEITDDSLDYVPDSEEVEPGFTHISLDEIQEDIIDPSNLSDDID